MKSSKSNKNAGGNFLGNLGNAGIGNMTCQAAAKKKARRLVREKKIPYPPTEMKCVVGEPENILDDKKEIAFEMIKSDDDIIFDSFKDLDDKFYCNDVKDERDEKLIQVLIMREVIEDCERYRLNKLKYLVLANHDNFSGERNSCDAEYDAVCDEIKNEKFQIFLRYKKFYEQAPTEKILFSEFYRQFREFEKCFMYLNFNERLNKFFVMKRRQIFKRIFKPFLIDSVVDPFMVNILNIDFVGQKRQRSQQNEDLIKANESLKKKIRAYEECLFRSGTEVKKNIENNERIFNENKKLKIEVSALKQNTGLLRNTVNNLNEKINELNERNSCKICFEEFDDDVRRKKIIIPCYHTICSRCCNGLLLCPFCNGQIQSCENLNEV